MLNAFLGSTSSCINIQIGNEASGQPCSLLLPIEHGFLSPRKVDFFLLLARISCNLAFPPPTEGSFNEKSKDQMLQAGPPSQSAPYLNPV